MEATSKDDSFSGDGDYEALTAALMANRQLLEAKVVLNNAMLNANDVATSQPGDFFIVGECDGQKTIDGEQVPLVLTPSIKEGEAGATGYEALVAALQAEREWLEGKVVANSAVLLRGFGVRDAAEFDAVVESLGWPDIRYVGPAPRTHIHGRVWTANEGPLEEFIYYHHEMVLVSAPELDLACFTYRSCNVLLIVRTDQGVPGEGDPVLRGTATGGRGDAVRAELPGDGAGTGGVPGDGGEAGRQGATLHLHGAEQGQHQVHARARMGGCVRH